MILAVNVDYREARALYVTAAGMNDDLARLRIRAMHGEHRITRPHSMGSSPTGSPSRS